MPLIIGEKNKATGKIEEKVRQKELPLPICPYCGEKIKSVENRTYGKNLVIVACAHCMVAIGAFHHEKKKSIF